LTETDSQPDGIDSTTPNVARIYDYLLGGKDNISQVDPADSHSSRTPLVLACQADYSKTVPSAV